MGIKKVAVVGNGIAGISTAYFLAKRGMEVDIYDKNKDVAHPPACSYQNGGQLSVSNSEVWNTWENVFRGLGWLFKKDAPLALVIHGPYRMNACKLVVRDLSVFTNPL